MAGASFLAQYLFKTSATVRGGLKKKKRKLSTFLWIRGGGGSPNVDKQEGGGGRPHVDKKIP